MIPVAAIFVNMAENAQVSMVYLGRRLKETARLDVRPLRVFKSGPVLWGSQPFGQVDRCLASVAFPER